MLEGKNVVVYDCEIENVIDGEEVTWGTFDKMGLSVGSLFDYRTGDYNVYLKADISELCDRLNEAEFVVGFNIKGFDNKLLRGLGGLLRPDLTLNNYDMLEQARKACGGGIPKGLKLDDILEGTFGAAYMKTEHGSQAPVMWQEGKHAKVISYCIADVRREKMLFEHIYNHGWINTKVNGRRNLDTRMFDKYKESA
jgi:DEAD/DEAH box helicase domain-containing protein